MEWHWQRAMKQSNGPEKRKLEKTNWKSDKHKTTFYEGIGSRFERMNKSKNEIDLFLISSRSGRTDISKYRYLG